MPFIELYQEIGQKQDALPKDLPPIRMYLKFLQRAAERAVMIVRTYVCTTPQFVRPIGLKLCADGKMERYMIALAALIASPCAPDARPANDATVPIIITAAWVPLRQSPVPVR